MVTYTALQVANMANRMAREHILSRPVPQWCSVELIAPHAQELTMQVIEWISRPMPNAVKIQRPFVHVAT